VSNTSFYCCAAGHVWDLDNPVACPRCGQRGAVTSPTLLHCRTDDVTWHPDEGLDCWVCGTAGEIDVQARLWENNPQVATGAHGLTVTAVTVLPVPAQGKGTDEEQALAA